MAQWQSVATSTEAIGGDRAIAIATAQQLGADPQVAFDVSLRFIYSTAELDLTFLDAGSHTRNIASFATGCAATLQLGKSGVEANVHDDVALRVPAGTQTMDRFMRTADFGYMGNDRKAALLLRASRLLLPTAVPVMTKRGNKSQIEPAQTKLRIISAACEQQRRAAPRYEPQRFSGGRRTTGDDRAFMARRQWF